MFSDKNSHNKRENSVTLEPLERPPPLPVEEQKLNQFGHGFYTAPKS